METYIVDTSAWLAYFDGDPTITEKIENNSHQTPAIVIAELARVLERKKIAPADRKTIFSFVEQTSLILEFNSRQARDAGEFAEKEKLPFVDGLIYYYCSDEKRVLTADAHFENKKLAEYVKLQIHSK